MCEEWPIRTSATLGHQPPKLRQRNKKSRVILSGHAGAIFVHGTSEYQLRVTDPHTHTYQQAHAVAEAPIKQRNCDSKKEDVRQSTIRSPSAHLGIGREVKVARQRQHQQILYLSTRGPIEERGVERKARKIEAPKTRLNQKAKEQNATSKTAPPPPPPPMARTPVRVKTKI